MSRIYFGQIALMFSLIAPVCATPPSKDPENESPKLAPEDKEAWGYVNKAHEALKKGLVDRASALADMADKIKRTRETAHLQASIELRKATDEAKSASELLAMFARLGIDERRLVDPQSFKTLEASLNLANGYLEDTKLWQKEAERLDPKFNKTVILSKEIKKFEARLDGVDKVLVSLKASIE